MTTGAALVEIALLVPVLALAWLSPLVPVKQPTPVVAMGESFDEVWKDTVPKIRVIPITSVNRLVKTERIIPPVDDVPVDALPVAVTPVARPTLPSRQRVAVVVRDACSRHGQRKVMVGRYRWRCR